MKSYEMTCYNVIKDLQNGKSVIFNTISRAIYKLDTEYINQLKKVPIVDLDDLTRDELLKSYIIHEKGTEETKISKFAVSAIKAQTKSIALTIIPSKKCNLRCVYCIQNNLFDVNEEVEIDKEIIDKIVNWISRYIELWKVEEIKVLFYGGEPLTTDKDVLTYLFDSFEKLPIDVSMEMVTNGTLVMKHKELMERINEYRITIDGLPDLHDKRRVFAGGNGSYKTIIENLKEIVKYDVEKLVIRINVDKDNREVLKETVDKIMEDLSVKNLKFVLHPVQPYNDVVTIESLHEDLKETGRLMADCLKYLQKKGNKISMWTLDCGVSSMSLWVFDTEGSIYKCLEHTGHVEERVSTLYQDSMTANFYEIMDRTYDSECMRCIYFGICLGGCYRQHQLDGIKQCYKSLFDNYIPSILETLHG